MQLPLEGLAEKSGDVHAQEQKSKQDEETRRLLAAERQREYREKNHAKIREIEKKSRALHREEVLAKQKTPERRKKDAAYQRAYRKRLTPEQRERIRICNLNYSRTHKAARKASTQKSNAKHQDRIKNTRRNYRLLNGEKIRRYFREYLPDYRAKQRVENPEFLLVDRMRATLKRGLSAKGLKKTARTEALIGCTILELKQHIEAQFVNGMCWSNPASFCLDHFVPIAAFDVQDDEERLCAFNWKNLRPMDHVENKRKSDKILFPLPTWLPAHIALRILSRRGLLPCVSYPTTASTS